MKHAKNVATTIKLLEEKLSICANISEVCKQASKAAEEEIEEHFDNMMNALSARKAELLGEVKQKVDIQSIFLTLYL